ncbi:hypothetical protein POM88_004046 [Heracleum sosnowskyi]|uniref:Uncharacterized protein n=1 Tax=Heracleum sosnowskyi TaxID=360622 RepID=A0AAD8JKS6_9APIA|nr:hypothetical protein POM88_004046 [Heracleum sosnowskyi]
MNPQNENALVCPTFSSYTTDRLVEIATRVSDDYKNIIGDDDDLFEFALSSLEEFDSSALVNKSSVFPVFNREQLQADQNIENRISTSSDESDSESETIGSCVWRRKSIGSSSPNSCKKSKSTGSVLFKRFKICDLLRRSNSDGIGKETYLFSSKIDKSTNKIDYRKSPKHSVEVTRKGKASPASSAHEMFYIQNRSIKEGDKRKSYLPYRQDLIGFFSVLGRASRT